MQLTLIQPDDWHLHLRDEETLRSVLPHTAAQFARAIVMPNLTPPVTNTERAAAYRQRIIDATPNDTDFTPLMTLYLTDNLTSAEVKRGAESKLISAVKLYPAGATTNSDAGISDIEKTYPVLETLQALGLPLLVHAEVTDSDVDIFDREKIFIERHLLPITTRFPELKVVFEHVTTKNAVEFVNAQGPNVAATITAHHLLYSRNALLVGGIHPHYYCLPILKRETHRQALLEAATSGSPKFFLGTDSAPHPVNAKESACGCAGCYTAHAAIELYAEAFDTAGALDKLEGFASLFGPDFYGLPRNKGTITLVKETWNVPDSYPLGGNQVIPLRAGEAILWRLL